MEDKFNEIVTIVKKTDPITRYLLFTQTFTYMGMSLPTAAFVFWGLFFFQKMSPTKKEEEPPETKKENSYLSELTRLISFK